MLRCVPQDADQAVHVVAESEAQLDELPGCRGLDPEAAGVGHKLRRDRSQKQPRHGPERGKKAGL